MYKRQAFDQLVGRGLTVSYLVIDGEVRGVVAQGDQIKPTAREAVRQLKARGKMCIRDRQIACRRNRSRYIVDCSERAGRTSEEAKALIGS